ncbi:MAG: hypothetical protein HRT54_00895 [Colwellia sp.]|nr:hypothetical protein [Colwellia sp.]
MYIKILSFICLLSSFYTFSGWANNAQSITVPIHENIAGKALHQYANIWWQWTSSMSDKISPVRDKTGEKCHVNQQGDVWFLAGGFGTSKIQRHCIIPQGKHIFFPIINMAYWPENNISKTCEEVKQESALNNSELYFVYAELDGLSIPNMRNNRIKSENCFDLHELLARTQAAKKVYPAATDGYWLMLRPLSKGIHSLKFNAQYQHDSAVHGNMMQDIEYTLEVK